MLFFLSAISVSSSEQECRTADIAMYESVEEFYEDNQLFNQSEASEALNPIADQNFPTAYIGWYDDDHLSDIPLPPPKLG
jgi:hypothetical protein